jgi:alpha-mannosidase
VKHIEAVVVSHTHWDREWYLPFQQFRARLVALVDYVIDLLERKESFRCFTLDGQAIVLDDYLEIRPENEERLGRLIRERRLLVGPWYVLPDEFLSTEEALVRNLLVGGRVARRFGAVMGVGYVPDPFGHIGQLPQILRGFGISSAVFSRGMGDEGEALGAEFRWRSPDGSEVLGIWLPAHYGCLTPVGSFNPWESDARFAVGGHAALPLDEAVRFTRNLVEHLAARSRTGVVLLDTGSDHLAPRQDLPEIIERLQAALREVERAPADVLGVRLVQGSLEDYVQKVRERIGHSGRAAGESEAAGHEALPAGQALSAHDELPVHEGEFRGSRYQNMLYSVLSSRIPLKQLNYEVDAWLTHYAEPLACAAWLFAGRRYPTEMLKLAWRLYLQNQAHDSICGCSTDEVAVEMTARYTQAREIAAAVAAESLASLANLVRHVGPVAASDTDGTGDTAPMADTAREAETAREADAAGTADRTDRADRADRADRVNTDHSAAGTVAEASTAVTGAAATPSALRKTAAAGSAALPLLVYNPNPWPVSGVVIAHVPLREIACDGAHDEAGRESRGEPGGEPGEASHGRLGSEPGTEEGTASTRFAVTDGSGRAVGAQTLGLTRAAGATGLGYGFDPSAALSDAVRRGEPAIDIAFPVRDLPATGYRVYGLASAAVQPPSDHADELVGRVMAGDRYLENEFLRVQVSQCGALDVCDKRTGFVYRGLNVFEDSGDAGDEYDYSPVADEPTVTRGVAACEVTIEHQGPYLGTLRVEMPWEIPASIDPGRKRRAAKTAPLVIVTRVTLAAGASYVEISTEIENTARDHRLRALFPTGARVDRVYARGQFDVVERDPRPRHDQEGAGGAAGAGWFQPAATVAPHQGFVDANDGVRGLAVATRGLPEYECLVERDGTATIAVTLLRCVERISRDDLATRKGHAGPPVFTPGAQCLGRHVFEYVVVPHAGCWSTGDVGSIVQRYMYPCAAYLSTCHAWALPAEFDLSRAELSLLGLRDDCRGEDGDRCGDGCAAECGDGDGDGGGWCKASVLVVSAVKKAEDGGDLIVRLHNPSEREISARLTTGVRLDEARLVRLDETPVEPVASELAHGGDERALGPFSSSGSPGDPGNPGDLDLGHQSQLGRQGQQGRQGRPSQQGQQDRQGQQGQQSQQGLGSACDPDDPSCARYLCDPCVLRGPYELGLRVKPKQVVTLALAARPFVPRLG